ncbi:MAG: Nucleoid occlusion protein [Chroococcidiopsis sp. SAG 2025]|uniref:ParB/RepB/Spo0J family partition protein n=1 Tax=Chroococcidiopsis sp. SAG 2025 TaxID=171389 RepID=UPI00293701B0|nr:ParB/RepB/Spo0J family partition protein [Chroococcidiopsis sp. SAG 2025]MDV2994150.1 Nucleoid occlusion protein [Chroococcidiopsis sp. SAG 2025]
MAEGEANRFKLVPIAQIQLSHLEQPRHHFESEALNHLASSILQHGILHPLLVRPISSATVKYELVAGERRFRAAVLAGLDAVPVVIRELGDLEAATLTLVENLQREDLDAIEETRGIVRLLALRLQLGCEAIVSLLVRMAKEAKGQTAQNVLDSTTTAIVIDMFSSLGKMSWESFVTCRLPLLNLPLDLQAAIQTQALNYTKALALSRLKDDERRSLLLRQVLEQNLSVRQIQNQIRQLQQLESPNQIDRNLFNHQSKCFQTNFEADLEVYGAICEDRNTKANTTENQSWNPASVTGATESPTLEIESGRVQNMPPSHATQIEQSTGERVSFALNHISTQSGQQDFEEPPFQEALDIQMDTLTQIETISRQVRESLASNRQAICTPKQQRQLLKLLAQLHQILGNKL